MGQFDVGGIPTGEHKNTNTNNIRILTIGSGSAGNSTLVYNDTTAILLDCGTSMKTVLEKTAMSKFDAMFISHAHGDHSKGAGPLGRKTKTPVYVSQTVVDEKKDLFYMCDVYDLREGTSVTIGDMTILPFSTKHDAASSFGFVVKDSTATFGYLTDTGSISKVIREALKDCTSIFIEADYDEQLIQDYDGYDDLLKERIMSDFGHLSTQQALAYIATLDLTKLNKIILGHISSRTNTPELVWKHVNEQFEQYTSKFILAPVMDTIEV